MDNVRYNISPCSPDEARAFIGKIDESVYIPNGAIKANDRSHYDRYSYLCNENRIAVVYDTTASIISITGRRDYASVLLELFAPNSEKTIKLSTVPAQQASGTKQNGERQTQDAPITSGNRGVVKSTLSVGGSEPGTRAKLFVPPERIKRRPESAQSPTMIATYRGLELSTDEIYPPQIVKRRSEEKQDKHAESLGANGRSGDTRITIANSDMRTQQSAKQGAAQYDQSANTTNDTGGALVMRRARISFGDEEDDGKAPRMRTELRGGTGVFGDEGSVGVDRFGEEESVESLFRSGNETQQKRKRGRPPKAEKTARPAEQKDIISVRRRGRPRKMDAAQNDYVSVEAPMPEYKNGYSIKNYPPDALAGALKRLREDGKGVSADSTEFAGTIQEVRSYTVSDSTGQKVILRYATKKMTLQLQGKRSELFGEVQSQVSHDSDYSSALEGYIETAGGKEKKSNVSDVQARLKKRLPTAFEYLSEQSRIDFSYGIHDFGMSELKLSDYSVLLVPAFRGLERFIFDLQRAEGIRVKMIGQAFDKNDDGKYILKSGYTQRIGSVIYAEVMVALYTEYFSRRNFFAHSDNTEGGESRSISDRASAKRIFDNLLDLVEYNAKKLKEIGFSMKQDNL